MQRLSECRDLAVSVGCLGRWPGSPQVATQIDLGFGLQSGPQPSTAPISGSSRWSLERAAPESLQIPAGGHPKPGHRWGTEWAVGIEKRGGWRVRTDSSAGGQHWAEPWESPGEAVDTPLLTAVRREPVVLMT